MASEPSPPTQISPSMPSCSTVCLTPSSSSRLICLPLGDADGRGETAFVRRAEDRAALVQDAGRVLRRERDVLDGIVEAFVALDEADAVVAEPPAGFGRAADDGVEAGAVAAAGENADSFGFHLPPPLDWSAAKTSHRKFRAWAAAQRWAAKRSRERSSIQSARLTQSILAAAEFP